MDVIGGGTERLSSETVRAALSAADADDARRLLLQQVTSVALLVLDPDGHVLTWGRGAEQLKGYRSDEVLGRHFSIFYPPEAVAVGHPQRELELAALTGSYTEDGWRVRRDGTRFWARVTILALRDEEDQVRFFGKVTLDLTAERQAGEQTQNVLRLLEETMRLDHLTGLPNRRAWDERIAALVREAHGGRRLTVAIVDLDHFKDYNDAHGHVAGDHLLKRAAVRWREVLRPGDLLARYGGEEFVLALPDCGAEEAHSTLRRMMPQTPEGCTFSAGIAAWEGEEGGSDLIDRADRALYAAKASGRRAILVAPPRDVVEAAPDVVEPGALKPGRRGRAGG